MKKDAERSPEVAQTAPEFAGEPNERDTDEPASPSTLIVAVGASAGGLEALRELVAALPRDANIAWLILTHQHPDAATMLPELLQRASTCPVHKLEGNLLLRPNTVYVTPPGAAPRVDMGVVELEASGAPRPIDALFRSLAAEMGENAVGVILSGTGNDGARGAGDIKTAGGLMVAQDPATAKFPGMPSAAMTAGAIDVLLPPAEIPTAIARHFARRTPDLKDPRQVAWSRALNRLIAAVRGRTGHDFTGYKRSTVLRRIDRRISARGFDDLRQYAKYAQETPAELDILFKEILISVTSFFRDEEAFACLAGELRRALKDHADEGRLFRVWVSACATGEEAYSIAILVRELTAALGRSPPVQIFATDLDAEAIDFARSGRYPLSIADQVSAERLERFFVKTDSEYRVHRDIRELVVFAVQNVVKDPPFTRLDLLACRNFLIYLDQDLQRHVLGLYTHALVPGGLLFLGGSETLGRFDEAFETVDKKQKIFRRRDTRAGPMPAFADVQRAPFERSEPGKAPSPTTAVVALMAERLMLSHLAPPSVLVGPSGDIVYFHGRTGQFLEPPAGEPIANVFGMARDGLRVELQAAMRQAQVSKEPVVRPGIQLTNNEGSASVRLSVRRLEQPEVVKNFFIVSFETERPPSPVAEKSTDGAPTDARVAELEVELLHTRESLHGTIEELETSNEELKSTNEELQSTNEELQSANEELETSREEMQSLNEELHTVNSELEERNRALSQANDDMQNLLNSTEIATVFLDTFLAIKRFTTPARKVFSLIDTDVGRPISDLTANLRYDGLMDDAREVLATLVFREREIQTREGAWRLMRIMPYRTADNVIDGLVMTFVDIDRIRREERQAHEAQTFGDEMLAQLPDGIALLDGELRILRANRKFLSIFRTSAKRVLGEPLDAALEIPLTVPALTGALQDVLHHGRAIERLATEKHSLNAAPETIHVSAHRFTVAGELRVFLSLEVPGAGVDESRRETQDG